MFMGAAILEKDLISYVACQISTSIFSGTTYLLLLNYYDAVLLHTALIITDIYFVFTRFITFI